MRTREEVEKDLTILIRPFKNKDGKTLPIYLTNAFLSQILSVLLDIRDLVAKQL